MSPLPYALALLMVYLLAGVGCAVAEPPTRRRQGSGGAADVALLLLLWPLYAPLVLTEPPPTDDRERSLLEALRRVAGTPLAPLLPDRQTVRALSRSLRQAGARLREIDAVLARADMSEEAALDRLAAVEEPPGATARRAVALLRVQGIRRLRATRERYAIRLREIDDLLDQVAAQAELVRFLGDDAQAGGAPGEGLVRDLVARVEALDQMLDDGEETAGPAGAR
jgi:hypothetical protein